VGTSNERIVEFGRVFQTHCRNSPESAASLFRSPMPGCSLNLPGQWYGTKQRLDLGDRYSKRLE